MRTLLAAIGLSLASSAAAQAPASIAGRWRTDDGNAIVTIAPCAPGGAALCGWISELLVAQPPGGARDTRNPNPRLRNRKVVGSAVFTGLVRDGAAWKGRGYTAKEGRNFTARLKLDRGRLQVRGCVAIVCRTVVWTRS